MGNTEQSYAQKFHSKYGFIQLLKDQNFGQIKVYRKKQMNFDYVMILDKYMDQQQLQQVEKDVRFIYQSFLKIQQPMLLKIFNYQISKKNVKQCGIPMIKLYIQYFNYTLGNLMEKHQVNGQCFSYDQTLYIMNSVIETYLFFSGFNTSIFSCAAFSIFISPEGFLKFSPIRVKDFVQQPDALCKTLCHPTYKNVLVYQNNHKDFLNQFKKLTSQMTRLYKIKSYKNMILNAKQMFMLKKLQGQINACRTLNQLKNVIPISSIDGLAMNSKAGSEGSIPTSQRGATREFGPVKSGAKKSMKNRLNKLDYN